MLGIIIGYLLGSISPAYFLGRILKGIDIRKHGDGNAGTTNVYHVLGFWPAFITALYDLSKGLLSMFIAYKLGYNQLFVYLSGLAATIGHIFPFYLNFRGGQGSATSLGILCFFLYVLLKDNFLPIGGLVILLLAVLIIFLITRQKLFLALIVMPALGGLLYKNREFDLRLLFTYILLAQFFFVSIYLCKRDKVFSLKKETLKKILPWRSLLRPLAVIFPIAYFYLDKKNLLLILGILGAIPIIFDLIRLYKKEINQYFFTKEKRILKIAEEHRFSSISLFFISVFLTVLIFDKEIAIIAMVFVIFGDLFAKFFGSEYGRVKIFGEKTLEGSLAFLLACLLSGYILSFYLSLSAFSIVGGIIGATIIEALPLGINDNFSVAIFSSGIMYILEKMA